MQTSVVAPTQDGAEAALSKPLSLFEITNPNKNSESDSPPRNDKKVVKSISFSGNVPVES